MIEITKKDAISKVFINPENIISVEDDDIVHGRIKLNDGTVIDTWEDALEIMSKIEDDFTFQNWKATRK